MATSLEDVIRYLRTSGGTDQFSQPNFSGNDQINFAVDVDRDVGMTLQEQANAELAFKMWRELIAKPTEIQRTLGEENIVYYFSDDLSPGADGVTRERFGHVEVIINRNANPQSTEAGYHGTFNTSLHEIGHALGLSHPGPYNGPGELVYGVTNVYPEDTQQYTVMSYFDRDNIAVDGRDADFTDHLITTPLLHDIAAIQSIYGAATSVRSENTVYGYNSNVTYNILGITFQPFGITADRNVKFSIYDTGGIDTVDASDVPYGVIGRDGARLVFGYSNQIISLEQGTFSSIGSSLDDASNVVERGLNNVSIAYGTIIENAIGGGGDDTIIGNSVANRLEGRDGNDRIFGMGGNDIIDGGAGFDLIDGGDGFDTVSYESADGPIIRRPDRLPEGDLFNDTLISIEAYKLTPDADIFWAFAGNDEINGFGGNDEISGQGGNDRLFGGEGNDYLMGDAGNDTLSGDFGDDLLVGGIGDDILDGGFGLDRMYGGDGNDTYFVDNLGDVIVESGTSFGGVGGIDRVVSSVSHVLAAGVENLTLSFASTALNATGNNLNNELRGNGFKNVLNGGLGADLMIGGGGDDNYIVDNAGDIVDESTGSGTDLVQSSVSFSLANSNVARGVIENLTLTGTGAINATGSRFDNVLLGNSAANVLDGLEGNDRLLGAGGNDRIFAGSGDDYMSGGSGNDYMEGSTGNDRYDFTRGSFLFTNLGSDTIFDSGGFDRILIDSMSQLRSVVRSGYDAILTFDQGTIRVVNHFRFQAVESIEETGKSVVFATGLVGGNLSGIITGTKKSEVLDGKGGDDYLFAGKGNDTLLGGEGNDRLDGERGNDRLDGGTGYDILTGGSGRDTFVFAKGYGHDTVTDFNLFVDKLALFDLDDSVLIINDTEDGYELNFGEGDVLTLNMPQSKLPGSQHWFDPLAEKWLETVVSDIA